MRTVCSGGGVPERRFNRPSKVPTIAGVRFRQEAPVAGQWLMAAIPGHLLHDWTGVDVSRTRRVGRGMARSMAAPFRLVEHRHTSSVVDACRRRDQLRWRGP